MTFFLMMVLFPDVQKKAQAQIDAVIGKGRIPRLQDRASLPYIDALLRETLRYNPVVPLCKSILVMYRPVLIGVELAIPHVTVDADVYDGYYIPKGTF